MKNTKIWIRDVVRNGETNFYVGQKVTLFRRKSSGYPRSIKDGLIYTVKQIMYEDLLITDGEKDFKVNYTYLIPIEFLRGELINDFLREE